jgi:hypothetical protein
LLRDLLSKEEMCANGLRICHELVDVDERRNVLKKEGNNFATYSLNEEK